MLIHSFYALLFYNDCTRSYMVIKRRNGWHHTKFKDRSKIETDNYARFTASAPCNFVRVFTKKRTYIILISCRSCSAVAILITALTSTLSCPQLPIVQQFWSKIFSPVKMVPKRRFIPINLLLGTILTGLLFLFFNSCSCSLIVL